MNEPILIWFLTAVFNCQQFKTEVISLETCFRLNHEGSSLLPTRKYSDRDKYKYCYGHLQEKRPLKILNHNEPNHAVAYRRNSDRCSINGAPKIQQVNACRCFSVFFFFF